MTLVILAQLTPALLLLALLMAGRYPGERVLVRLAARRPARRLRGTPASPRRRPHRTWLRAGGLIGRHLAVRPPPALTRAR